MRIFDCPDEMDFEKTAVALGSFDGVHAAHRQVIENCIRLAKRYNLKSGVLLFKNPIKPVKIISSLSERIEQIEKIGVDFVCLCEFDEEFKRQTPEEFITFLHDKLNVRAVSAGFDYRFGYKAAGDADKLKSLAEKNNISVSICKRLTKNGVTISSTNIRQMIEKADLDSVKMLLARPFSVSGTVEPGLQNGRKIGFATANLSAEENRMLPPDGVYGGRTLYNGAAYPSVINIGKNPTFNGKRRTIESHLLNFSGDLYGKNITVEFDMFIRGEKKFKSVEELKKQIQKDKKRTENAMKEFQCLIMGAGMGTRMKSETPKVLHKICGKSLVEWVLDAAEAAGAKRACTIVGHKADMVKETLGERCGFALQEQQLGTGHAVMQAEDFIRSGEGSTLILTGDAPLITAETIKKAVEAHSASGAAATVMTAIFDNADGYGRIVRDSDGNVLKIVEHKDASDEERKIKEINAGMYIFENNALADALKCLKPNNAQGEYYLTDTLEILLSKGLKIGAYVVEDSDEISGINDRVQLSEAERLMQARINKSHMKNGVTMILPETIIIEDNVSIGRDTIIYPNVILRAGTKIGSNCVIGSNTQITASEIADNVDILSSVLLECSVGEGTHVGPFAYLRPNTHVGKSVRVGDFVELKNSNIDDGTKISHLTYVGDSDVGKRVNFGCGTVTVNYDGKNKHRTTIGDDCFIGCNTNLVAPVTVEDRGYTAAGSTITDTVPKNNLAIARARQVNKDTWKKDPRK